MLQMHAAQITLSFLDDLLPLPIKFSNYSKCCHPSLWKAEVTPIHLQIDFHTSAKIGHWKKIWETDSSPPHSPTHPNWPWDTTPLLHKLSFVGILLLNNLHSKQDNFDGNALFHTLDQSCPKFSFSIDVDFLYTSFNLYSFDVANSCADRLQISFYQFETPTDPEFWTSRFNPYLLTKASNQIPLLSLLIFHTHFPNKSLLNDRRFLIPKSPSFSGLHTDH